ncbi:chromatin modification-related protein EAF7-domain-containing protein [Zychaea mexicana]|uniref:chromatin modification-related protein EAF7-domain-containing protein n=1 Tax=Zychaea mexicana TaxID=64656 RepID=UPI0022FF1A93|nr:chromatin modification-related protein EAF7-domain-containing protein [Zychaea mexicana]KAI9497793.1 chromatin modification-related protein EAF7-domain-containing protein [Zychaea mexicana]
MEYDDSITGSRDWDVNLELTLLNAVARCKPVGIHKHFRIISIQRQFNERSPTQFSLQEIRDRLSDYYSVDALEELDKEDEEDEDEEEDDASLHEFSLPLDEYEQLISEHRQDEESSPSSSPSPAKKARTMIKRESSPVSSMSPTPTPEPEEGKIASPCCLCRLIDYTHTHTHAPLPRVHFDLITPCFLRHCTVVI